MANATTHPLPVALGAPADRGRGAGFVRWLRSLVVGGGATLVDLVTLELCVRVLAMGPGAAKLMSLLAGAMVQFVGSRGFAFGAREGNLRRQAALFALTELGTLALNWLAFRALLHVAGMPLEVATLAGSFVVFLGFSYPAWRLVFRVPPRTAMGQTREV